jgi:Icc-related predicted phosphoesterase
MNLTILTATDLHALKSLYRDLAGAVAIHKPDLVALPGDFLNASDSIKGRLTSGQCALALSQLPCPEIVFVRGNHEDENWIDFARAWRGTGKPLHALNGEVFIHGPLALVGFPCFLGDETPFLDSREPLPANPSDWLAPLARSTGPAFRTLWLMHEPPAWTPLSEPDGPLAGVPEWTEAIERFAPFVTISGHDHHSPSANGRWHHRIGPTLCVNVGQPDPATLHYSVIQAQFPSGTLSLASRLSVTAYPEHHTICTP